MSSPEELAELESTFSQMAVLLFAPGSVADTLQRVVDLADQTVEGCDGAGTMVIEGGKAATGAVSHPLVTQVDRLQIEAGEGPCLDAAESGTTLYVADLSTDERWPVFAPQAIAAGVRSVLALSLSTRHLSALNLYGFLPSAFDATERAQGVLFVTLARLALDSAEGRAAAGARIENLGEALRSRELIGQAQGILMEREGISADEAFDVLRRASQRLNIKLNQVARQLVERRDAPKTDR